MSRSVSNVSRTAFDSLKAKHSAACGAAYPVLSPFPTEHEPIIRDGPRGLKVEIVDEHDHVAALEASYRRLVEAMAARLEDMGLEQGRRRRQTPLVNAGYAMRASTLLSTILNFVRYHDLKFRVDDERGAEESRRSPVEIIQIVVLGAGLDVTGLWSMVAPRRSSTGVRVVEVDTQEICQIKGSAIEGMEQWVVTTQSKSPSEKCQDGFVLSAVPRNSYASSSADDEVPTSTYVLLELDFTEPLENIERVMSPWLKADVPTLFVSELVLAYVGDDPVDRLLRWLNDVHVQQVESSAMVAFEPLGPPASGPPNNGKVGQTIVASYRASYYQQFDSKMGRGNQRSGCNEAEGKAQGTNFQPIGSSCRDVESRLQRLGYANVHACLAGTATYSLFPRNHWTSREAFDEHAALALHLRSYGVVCGFGNQSTPVFRQLLCPWSTGGCPPLYVTAPAAAEGMPRRRIWLTKVSNRDEEESIRRLFLETYRDLSEANTSIRKMVKAAIKTDLSSSPVGSSSSETPSSQIHSHYKRNGGLFLVAKLQGDDQVVGAIGVRRLRRDEVRARGLPTNSAVFEIHRLMVDDLVRRQTIGTLLLDRAKELIVRFRAIVPFHLVATTPALLEGANQFYASHGFTVAQSKTIGELQMITHVALVQF